MNGNVLRSQLGFAQQYSSPIDNPLRQRGQQRTSATAIACAGFADDAGDFVAVGCALPVNPRAILGSEKGRELDVLNIVQFRVYDLNNQYLIGRSP
jgi:hypothetical protein